ncbi:RNA-directed DNA polymerase, eukaryota, reverse transcriptase zinc-binding domain protein [Tanacetum coccineum]
MCKNFFIGCDEGEKKLTWVKWKKCLACKKKGGLGIGSINALNLGLLFKWLWRFRCQSHDLWAKVITCVCRSFNGLLASTPLMTCVSFSNMGSYSFFSQRLNLNGIDLLALCTKKIGNGARTSFWNDPWCSSSPLKVRFPRIFMLETDKGSMVSNRLNIHNWSSILKRAPRGGIESSQLVDLLSAISAIILSDQPDSWVGFNKLFRLVVNLDRKGIDVDSTLCPICGDDVETINHLFFTCEMARVLWANLACWWDLDVPFCSSFSDWICWLDSSHLSAKGKFFLDGVGGTVLWTIWN